MRRVTFVVEAPDRLDRALAAGVPDLSRRRARALISAGAVYLDGQRCKVASRSTPRGAKVVLHLEAPAPPPKIEVLFEDEHLVAVNKPAGIAANESETSPRPSVVRTVGGVQLVHRLDLDTTGVMVLARTARAADVLSECFRERTLTKRYQAITLGVPEAGWIDEPIGPDRRRPRAYSVREDGRSARTEVLPAGARDGLAALDLRIETGRTHQIRVHLSHAGAPVLGDILYGAKAAVTFEGTRLDVTRPLLHAASLELSAFERSYRFEAPRPPDLEAIWARIVGGDSVGV